MSQELSNKENINIKKKLHLLLEYWHYFVISIIAFLGLAFLIIRYSDPIYTIKSSIIIKEKNTNISSDNFFGGLETFGMVRNIDNEIGVLKSFHLIHKTLSELHFEVSYFKKGIVRSKEIYDPPFIVKIDSAIPQLIGIPIYLNRLTDSSYSIKTNVGRGYVHLINSDPQESPFIEEIEVDDTVIIEKFYSNPYFSFTLLSDNVQNNYINEPLYFKINNLHTLTNDYIERLNLNTSTIESSIIEISITGHLIHKEKDFLNTLCNNDINWGLNQKNEIASNTIKFIDEQIQGFADSLLHTEHTLEKFRTNKDNMMDLDFQAKNSYELLKQLEQENVTLRVKDKYYTYLEEYINSNKGLDKLVAPSTIGINDPLLNNLINEINTLNSEKAGLSYSVKEKSPSYNIIDLKLKNSKKTLIENIKIILKSSEISLKENENRMNATSKLLNKLPGTERELINIQRKFNHNDLIYNFLMEKRAAASIAKASNVAESKILDAATINKNEPLFPNKPLILALAILFSFFAPIALIFSKEMLRNTINNEEDVLKYSSIELLGIVPHTQCNIDNKIEDPILKEHLSILRSNLNQLCHQEHKIIGVTSTSKNEGKSFISTNLAISLAHSGKKTVLLETNFRRPSLASYFGFIDILSLNDYLENELDIEKIIYSSSHHNLDLIFTKNAHTKQDELLNSHKFKFLINYLKDKYDVIIIDSAPIGYFSDYYSISSCIDINLIVLRSNFTKNEVILKLNELKNSCFNKSYLILNDFVISKQALKAFHSY